MNRRNTPRNRKLRKEGGGEEQNDEYYDDEYAEEEGEGEEGDGYEYEYYEEEEEGDYYEEDNGDEIEEEGGEGIEGVNSEGKRDKNTPPVKVIGWDILIVGDSVAAGYTNGGNSHHPFSSRLETNLKRIAATSKVMLCCAPASINHVQKVQLAAQSNESLLDMKDRLEELLLARQSTRGIYTHVIICAGFEELDGDTPVDEIIDDLKAMHRAVKKYGIQPVVLTIPEFEDENDELADDRVDVNDELRKLVKEVKGVLVDVDTQMQRRVAKLWDPDSNMHMSPAGYDQLADIIFDTLKKNSNKF